MTTSQDYTIANYRGYGAITVPANTRLTHKTALGIDVNYHFVDDLSWVEQNYPQYHPMMLKHDIAHYGIDVPKEFVKY